MTSAPQISTETRSSPPRARSSSASSYPLFNPTRIARSLSVEPGEERRTALLFVLLILASIVFDMGRATRDALFLTRYPVTWIAHMWIAYGVVSSVAAVGYGWISSRVSRARLAIIFAIFSAVSYVAFRVAIGADFGWAIVVFYVWAEVIANLFILQAWAITNDLHDPRSGRRLFGLIGAGRIVGMLFSGFLTGSIVRAIGTPNLIVVVAAIMIVFAGLVRFIGTRFPLARPKQQPGAGREPTASLRRHKKYTFFLSIMLLTAFIALTVGDYQFKAIVKFSYPERDDVAEYMARFYALMGTLALFVQLFVAPRVLKYLGVIPALFAMPVAFLGSTAALLFSPVLPIATMMKLSDNGLQYTIHEATMQLLYFAYPASLRTRVRAILDAMIKPLGCSLGGVVLVFLSPVPFAGESLTSLAARVASVGFVSLTLGIAWVGVLPLVRWAYVDALHRALVRRQSDLREEVELQLDASMEKVLRTTVHSGTPVQVTFAFEVLALSSPKAAREEFPRLIAHESPIVRAFGVEQIARLDPERAADLARAQLADPDPDVRCAAIATLGSVRQEDAVDEIEHFAYDDAHPRLRNEAIVTLISHGGLPGVLAGGARLQQLIHSRDENDRIEAAVVVGNVGQKGLARTLKPLLKDESLLVRRTAATAARGCASTGLLDAMLEAMSERSLVKPLIAAIIAVGPEAIPELANSLRNEDTPRLVRLSIPRVLHGIGTMEALEVLRGCFGTDDEGVRQKCLASASRLREELQAPALPPQTLKPWIQREIEDHVTARDGWLSVRPWLTRPLLDRQLQLELRGHIVRIMRLCEQAYPREQVAAARNGIFSRDATRRANALEVLDNVLDREHRLAIVDIVGRFATEYPFVDDREPVTTPVPERVKHWFAQRVALPGFYRRSVLFEAVGHNRVCDLAEAALAHTRRSNPFLRENALIALAACRPVGWQDRMERALNDEDAVVRAYATYVMQTGRSGLDPGDEMYTTVEKILYLQGVSLFSNVPGNELVPLAMRARVIRLAPGDVVFHEGDPGDSLFIVFHGQIALHAGGRELAVLGEGEVLGELAMLDEAPRTVTATAVGDADVLQVSTEDFRVAVQD
ncbi:MAG TPA: HEAT repeat domain-containing protein, partial [Polyangiaceae bacterium]|nr:HEAT repeat domain-containing protein [Polyangiaceae bacterium]